eukprot:TRINITY_DN1121_c0_g2_i4.p3 TRINITY_DN1121_c0_g2~~TRINITY_DN1121_c0_g2_i4.p3  ORF type:complete len:212 (-),score=41.89 TRINITY_DN1121_c0_g2_i4:536-1171(-)
MLEQLLAPESVAKVSALQLGRPWCRVLRLERPLVPLSALRLVVSALQLGQLWFPVSRLERLLVPMLGQLSALRSGRLSELLWEHWLGPLSCQESMLEQLLAPESVAKVSALQLGQLWFPVSRLERLLVPMLGQLSALRSGRLSELLWEHWLGLQLSQESMLEQLLAPGSAVKVSALLLVLQLSQVSGLERLLALLSGQLSALRLAHSSEPL